MINAVLSSGTFTCAGNIADEKGKTPLHIAVKSHWKREISSVVLSALVQSNVGGDSDNAMIKTEYLRPNRRVPLTLYSPRTPSSL